jgi:hypothetical protein
MTLTPRPRNCGCSLNWSPIVWERDNWYNSRLVVDHHLLAFADIESGSGIVMMDAKQVMIAIMFIISIAIMCLFGCNSVGWTMANR